MKKLLLFASLVLFESLAPGQTKQVCFTFDDLPIVSYGISDTNFQKNLTDKLVLALRKNKIPAIGFVNGRKLHNEYGINQFQIELLNKWMDNGLDLGNHTYSHPDYNRVSLKDYASDIISGEPLLKEILGNKEKSLRYFRHPFLHLGNTKVKADSLSNFLTDHGYTIAPVTIDNDDYLFAVAYKRAQVKRDTTMMIQIGHDYIDYMGRKKEYFEKQARSLFGRDISQILLLHASSLNSDYTDSLAAMFSKDGYSFISIDKALEDEVYKTEVTMYVDLGISWIDRWALSQGKKGDFFKDDPIPPNYIKEILK